MDNQNKNRTRYEALKRKRDNGESLTPEEEKELVTLQEEGQEPEEKQN